MRRRGRKSVITALRRRSRGARGEELDKDDATTMRRWCWSLRRRASW
jgi:hypothetical protein